MRQRKVGGIKRFLQAVLIGRQEKDLSARAAGGPAAIGYGDLISLFKKGNPTFAASSARKPRKRDQIFPLQQFRAVTGIEIPCFAGFAFPLQPDYQRALRRELQLRQFCVPGRFAVLKAKRKTRQRQSSRQGIIQRQIREGNPVFFGYIRRKATYIKRDERQRAKTSHRLFSPRSGRQRVYPADSRQIRQMRDDFFFLAG